MNPRLPAVRRDGGPAVANELQAAVVTNELQAAVQCSQIASTWQHLL